VAGLSFAAVFFLAAYNKIKVEWTNDFYNKLLRKEVISDQSTYYHFSLNIIGEDDQDWIKDKIVIKKAKFFNFKFILEVLLLMIFPLPGNDLILLFK
jgi:c-di-AMP phosphodiesterase-like protein